MAILILIKTFISKVFILILGVIFSIFFVILPTLRYNPEEQIGLIEADLAIILPAYEIIYKEESWLGFNLSQEVQFKFSSNDAVKLQKRILKSKAWQSNKDGYYKEITAEKYFAKANYFKESRTLIYNYYEF